MSGDGFYEKLLDQYEKLLDRLDRKYHAALSELDAKAARIKEQEARIKEQEARIKEQKARIKEQKARIKELEGQVCAAREHLDGIEKLIAPEDEDNGLCFVCKQVFAAFSSSTPCPHEAKVKRLREAIDWACEHESNGRLVDIDMAEFLRRAGGE